MSCSDTQVVQQIDQMTSSIDLEEEDNREASGCCNPSERNSASKEAEHVDTSMHNSGYPNNTGIVVSTVPRATRRLQACSKVHRQRESTPSIAPPAYPDALLSKNNSQLKFNRGAPVSQTKGPKSEAKSQKPPPYPFNSRTWRANKEETPPYAGRRRLLSTTV